MKYVRLSLVVLALCGGRVAAEPTVPIPVARVSPQYPVAQAQSGMEGWVGVKFRLTPDGRVADPFVSDSSGEIAFEQFVLRAVSQWRYAPLPASEPQRDRCGIEVRLSLALGQSRPRREFRKRLDAAHRALAQGDLAATRTLSEQLDERRIPEHALHRELEADLAAASGDLDTEALALERARHYGDGSGLSLSKRKPSARYLAIGQRSARVLYDLGQIGKSLAAIDSLRREGAVPTELAALEAQLRARVSAPEALVTPGVTRRLAASHSAPATWSAPLLRQRFRVEPESGWIERVDVCCANATFSFDAGSGEQRLPSGASECKLLAFGTEGSRLTLVELASEQAATPNP